MSRASDWAAKRTSAKLIGDEEINEIHSHFKAPCLCCERKVLKLYRRRIAKELRIEAATASPTIYREGFEDAATFVESIDE